MWPRNVRFQPTTSPEKYFTRSLEVFVCSIFLQTLHHLFSWGGIDTPHISQGFNPPCFPPGQSPHQKDNSFCGVGTWLPKRPEEPNFSSLTWQRAPPYGRVKIFWGSLHFLSTFFFPQIASFNYRGSNTSSWGGEGSLPNFFFGQFHVVADTITYGRKERNTFTRWWGSQIW